MPKKKVLKGLTPEAFVSDRDRWALDKLQRVPLLPTLIKKFSEVGLDRWLYCYNMSMAVRCGPNQYKTLYNILTESAAILDMPAPELYITNNPFTNAFAGGIERPYITIRSSTVDALTDEQLYHTIGHELGHIKANHVLYTSIAYLLFPLLEMIGRRTLGIGDAASIGLVLALSEWSRQAEISADRAGLLVCQNLETSLDANLAFTAGPNRLRHESSREAFMEQARAYQDAGTLESIGKVLIFLLMSSTYSHPMPVHRAQELERWALSGAYDRILAGTHRSGPNAKSA